MSGVLRRCFHSISRAIVLLLASIVLIRCSVARPEGVQQLLPRGRIPAIFDPEFVTEDAAVIPDDAWVLGVLIDGEAKAYSLNLLNQHEVVNDHSGETPFAAVW